MTYEQLIEEVRSYCKFGGYADVEPEPDFAGEVNEAYREISTETEYNFEDTTITTVVGQAEYDLIADSPAPTDLRDWIRVTDVLWGTDTRIDQTDEVTIRGYDNLWTKAANAQPTYWWPTSPNTIRFYAPPSSIETVYIHGSRDLGPLVSAGIPTFPVRYHDAIALRAAWNLLKRNATGSSLQRAIQYKNEAQEIIGKFKGEIQDQRAVVFRRRMTRRSPERISLGGLTYRRY